jgi:hypothetical protein
LPWYDCLVPIIGFNSFSGKQLIFTNDNPNSIGVPVDFQAFHTVLVWVKLFRRICHCIMNNNSFEFLLAINNCAKFSSDDLNPYLIHTSRKNRICRTRHYSGIINFLVVYSFFYTCRYNKIGTVPFRYNLY